MKIRKAYKFLLKPSAGQIQWLERIAGHCRFLWNKVLHLNLERLRNKQSLIWYHEADYWSKIWKSSNDYAFLKEVPAHCLQQKLKDLTKAFKDAFDKSQLKRLPTYRKRCKHDSFRFPEPLHIKIDNRRAKLPKIGWIGFFKSQPIRGELKSATVSRSCGKWYISFQVELDRHECVHPANTCIGIDMGIAQFATLSNGEAIAPISAFKKWEKCLAKKQRELAKKRKYSENWKNQKQRIQKIHSKIANVRHDFLHKRSTQLSKNHAMIVVENLQVRNMSRSAKGTVDSPGNNVKAKSGLNKAILDQGFGEFRRQLEYKLNWQNGIFLKVDPKYTSQRCSQCGHIEKNNRPSQAEFVCLACGHQENADVNAAKNILAAGHAVLACGEFGLTNSMKQEPLRNCERVAA